MKKICVVTGTRAEYGLLRWIMEEIKKSNLLNQLKLYNMATIKIHVLREPFIRII